MGFSTQTLADEIYIFLLIDRNDKDKNSFLLFFGCKEITVYFFFNAGRKVDPVFKSKNMMVDWWIFFLFINFDLQDVCRM